MTLQALNTALTGLRAAQQQLGVISNNVSNATTPGYNRQILPQSTQVLESSGQTVGVLTGTVIRQVDLNLQRDLFTQVSATSLQDVKINALQQIQNFNGPPDRGFSIAAQLADLRDNFSALSDTPDDTQALQLTLNQANVVADKFNDYSDLVTQLRNDAQGDLQTSVNRVNSLLQEIDNINQQVRNASDFGRSAASLQDRRDIAINELTENIDITFFERADGLLVVQTREGQELVGDVANRLEFNAVPLSAQQFFPDSASGLTLVSETNNRETRIDITESIVGGRLGGLLELRDEVLPSYHAQLDELAFQTAQRFAAQGLELFTDQNGFLPEDGVPNPTTNPPTPVPYVDFARNIQVNRDIENDITLLQRGTFDSETVVPTGDNSVIRRVLENTFGNVEFQQVDGTIDLGSAGAAPGPELQELLGLSSTNRVVTGADLTTFTLGIDDGVAGTADLIESFEEFFPAYPNNDSFDVIFEEARGPNAFGPTPITLDLSDAQAAFPIGSPGINNAADQIVAQINAQALAAGLTPEQAQATLNSNGQLVIESTANVTIAPNTITPDALAALGIQQGTFTTEDPSFNVQVGNDAPITITLEPGDDVFALQAKLEFNPATGEGVPGLFVDVNAAGGLVLRPGIDDSNFGPLDTAPLYGGDITISGGSFLTDNAAATNATINGLSEPVGIISALFGSFTDDGTNVRENSPTTDVGYSFGVLDGSPATTNFRNQFLGPNAGISTDIFSADSLIDYAQKIIDATSQDFIQAQSAFENEDTLRGILQTQFSNDSGVNIDEEISNLIVVQTAYSAAARTVSAADEMFQELLNAFR